MPRHRLVALGSGNESHTELGSDMPFHRTHHQPRLEERDLAVQRNRRRTLRFCDAQMVKALFYTEMSLTLNESAHDTGMSEAGCPPGSWSGSRTMHSEPRGDGPRRDKSGEQHSAENNIQDDRRSFSIRAPMSFARTT